MTSQCNTAGLDDFGREGWINVMAPAIIFRTFVLGKRRSRRTISRIFGFKFMANWYGYWMNSRWLPEERQMALDTRTNIFSLSIKVFYQCLLSKDPRQLKSTQRAVPIWISLCSQVTGLKALKWFVAKGGPLLMSLVARYKLTSNANSCPASIHVIQVCIVLSILACLLLIFYWFIWIHISFSEQFQ